MRQLLDLARENAVLKEELTRIRQEAQMLQRVLSSGVNPSQDTTGASVLYTVATGDPPVLGVGFP